MKRIFKFRRTVAVPESIGATGRPRVLPAWVVWAFGLALASGSVVPGALDLPPSVTTFTEGRNAVATPVMVDSGLTVFDDAGLHLDYVAIGTGFNSAEESLSFTNDGFTTGNITGSYFATLSATAVNEPPSFDLTLGSSEAIMAPEDSGAFSSNLVVNISPGSGLESTQTVTFTVAAADTNFFDVQPAVSTGGTLTFTLATNAFGTNVITITAMDDGGTSNGGDNASDPQSLTLVVTPLPDPPVAVDDTYPFIEDSFDAYSAFDGVFSNDENPDRVELTALLVTDVAHGILSLQPDGSFSYTPDDNFDGMDSFQYRITDGTLTSAVATVTLELVPVNDPPRFTLLYRDGVTSTRRVAAWGWNDGGQTNVPAYLENVVQVRAGYNHSLALLDNGRVIAWGTNDHGQTDVPPGLSNVIAIAAGNYHNLALLDDDTVLAWGDGEAGEALVPDGLSGVARIAAGDQMSAAVGLDGTLVTWGLTSWIPENLTNVVDIDFGGTHALVLFGDGTVAVYGSGLGGPTNAPPGLSNVVTIAAGGWHDLALRNDGTLTAWGYNAYGQTNVPAEATNIVAISASEFDSLAVGPDGTLFTWGGDWQAGLTYTVETVDAQSRNGLAIFEEFLPALMVDDQFPSGSVLVVSNITPGPDSEIGQQVEFDLSFSGPPLFLNPPYLDSSGVLWFDLAPDAYGTNEITAVALDDGGNDLNGVDYSAPQTFQIIVVPYNAPPLAVDDAYSLDEDTGKSVVAAGGVLANDSDLDGDPMAATLVADVSHGSLIFSTDGSFSYSPAFDFAGTDSFQYQVTNTFGTSLVATVTLTVNPVNDSPFLFASGSLAIAGRATSLTGFIGIDWDAGTNHVGITFDVPGAVLLAEPADGVTVTTNSGNAGTLTLSGPLDDVNLFVALGSLQVIVPAGEATNRPVHVTIDDYGNTGADPGLTGTTTNEVASVTSELKVRPGVLHLSVPTNGTYRIGDQLDFVIHVSEPVTVTTNGGIPYFDLYLWNALRPVSYVSSENDTNWLFRYTVVSGDYVIGPYLGGGVETNGATAVDADGEAFVGTWQSSQPLAGITVDGIAPGISQVNPPSDQWYKQGASVSFTVTMDELVLVVTNAGIPRFTVTLDNTNAFANYVSGSGTGELTFEYAVRPGDMATNGITIEDTLDLNGGTIRDAAGNPIVVTTGTAISLPGVLIDGIPPTFAYASFDLPVGGVLIEGDTLHWFLFADEDVTVDTLNGSPTIELALDSGAVSATYVSNSGPGILQFDLPILAGYLDTNGFLRAEEIELNGAVIQDAAGNEASVQTPAPYDVNGAIIDAVRPVLTQVTPPDPGIYGAGATLDFLAEFTEPVAYNGQSPLTLVIGLTSRTPVYVDGSGSNVLRFRYTVQSGEADADGVEIESAGVLAEAGVLDLVSNRVDLTVYEGTTVAAVRIKTTYPVAGDDAFTLNEDDTIGGTVSANDFDPDDLPLTTFLVSDATNGAVNLSDDGNFVYAPFTNYTGVDAFTYAVSDGIFTSAVATVTLTIDPVNDPPTLSLASVLTVTGSVARAVTDITIADPDAGTNLIHFVLAAGNFGDTLNATPGGGITVSNNSTLELHLWGAVSNLNTFIAAGGIAYTPASDLSPLLPLIVRVYDDGNAGLDPGLDSDPDGESARSTIYLDRGSSNDAPVLATPFFWQSGNYRRPFEYQFSALTFLDPDADSLHFEAHGLPPGISLLPNSRTLSGVPTAAGDYTVELVAGDQQSPELFATNTFTFSVGKAILTVTADNQTRAYGATNPPLTFQYSGFISPDDESVIDVPPVASTAADPASLPGIYPIDFVGGSDDNYDFLDVSGTLTVTNADLGEPTILAVRVPDSGTYRSGDVLEFVVRTSEPVHVTAGGSNAVLVLQLDEATRLAPYLSGSGSTELVFQYTIATGDSATNLNLSSVLETNETAIADLSGNLLDPTLDNIGSTAGIVIDGVPPQINSRTPPTNGWYKLGAVIEFTITLDEVVIVETNSGVPRFAVSLDETNGYAEYASGSGSNVLTFRHVVQAGEMATNGITLRDTLELNGGSLTDLAGNDIFLNFVPNDILPDVKVDGIPPFFFYRVTHFPEFVYRENGELWHILYAHEPISVDVTGGSPSIAVQLDSGPSHFLYVSNYSPTQLAFRLVVAAGDESADGFTIDESLSLNGAIIRDEAGNELTVLDLPEPHEAHGFTIDARRPVLTNAVPPAPGIYQAGEPIDVFAQFSESVNYYGPPPLTLQIGNNSRSLTYIEGAGSNILRFRYTVQAGDFDPDGIEIHSASTNNENGVLDLASNRLDLSVSFLTNLTTVRIDASRPVAIPDTFVVGEDLTLTASVSTNDIDADHDGLFVTTTSSVTNGSLSISADGTFTYVPATNFSGTDGFTYLVSDGLLVSTSGVVQITVVALNDPPILTVPTSLAVTSGVPRIVTGISVEDSDADNNPVHLSIRGQNTGLTLSASNGGGVTVSNDTALSLHLWGTVSNLNAFVAQDQISVTPPAGSGPLLPLLVRIEDNGNSGNDPGIDTDPASESDEALIYLEKPLDNDAPIVANPFEPAAATYRQSFSVIFPTNTFYDPEGDTLRYLATGLPDGITLTSSNRTFSGTPTAAGTYSVQLIAGDQQTPELFGTNTFTLTVEKFTLSAVADSKTRAVGTPNPTLTVSIDGFLGSDTINDLDVLPTASTAATQASPPGVYAIEVTGGSDNNYDFVYIAAPLTVTNGVSGGMAGLFSGLFYETNEIHHHSSGAIQLKTTDAGKYSGTLELAGKKLKFSGTLDSQRRATNAIPRKNTNTITVEIVLDTYTPPQRLLGIVTDGSWRSELFAARAPFHARTNPAPMAGRYTIVLPGMDGASPTVHGDGYGLVNVATSGKLSLAGALADGSKFSDGTVVNGGALWPLYVPLYKNQGSSIGWLLFSNAPAANPGGLVSWIRPSSFGGAIHGTGITNETTAVGSLYTPPLAGQTALSWTNGTIAASGGNLVSALTNNLFFSTANKVTLFGTNFSKVSLTAKTGKFKGSFKHPVTGRGISFNGVLLQDLDLGAGFFLGTNQSGRISIEPSP